MPDGILDIRAEIRIAALSEDIARQLVSSQRINQALCSWRRNPMGEGGHLYLGGQLFFDERKNYFTFEKPKKMK